MLCYHQSLKEKIISGAILCLSGIPKGIKRDEIKAAFGEHGKVEWVDIVEDQSVVRSVTCFRGNTSIANHVLHSFETGQTPFLAGRRGKDGPREGQE